MPRDLPVLLAFEPSSGRHEAWGRLEAVSAAAARLVTLATLERRQHVLLSFEVNGESFDRLFAVVARTETDADGYSLAELDFVFPTDRHRLSAALLDVLSR